MREMKSELQQHAARSRVRQMMPGEQLRRPERFESEPDHGAPGFRSQSKAPIRGAQVKSELVNLLARPFILAIGTQARATHVLIVREQENGPVLNLIGDLGRNLPLKPLRDF